MKPVKITLSRICWALAIAVSALYYGQYGKDSYNFYGDALGYYMYLPSTFIYHNHQHPEQLPLDRGIPVFIHNYVKQMGNGQRTPKGYILNQYTYGVALMEAPFFGAAHAWEKLSGGPANGYSDAYKLAIKICTLVYGALGLWLTYRLLRRRFKPYIASITTALLLLGTNLFWLVLQQHGMAHVPLFFLFALLLYLTIRIYEEGKWYQFALLGLVAGIITVIRPVDGLCVLIPLLYSTGRPWLQAKLAFLQRHWAAVLLAGACFLLPIIPQLLYWKWLTGYTVYDSYGPNQTFDFRHPHIWAGLFGASNGWLIYTPLMLLALAGLFRIRRLGPLALAIPVFLVLYAWAIYAWFLPNYPNGLGSRPMADAYALLAFPLAAALEWIGNRRVVIRVAAAVLVLLFTAVNISYTYQQVMAILWSENSNYAFNRQTLFRYHLGYDDLVVWDIGIPQPNPRKLRQVVPPYCTRLDDSALSANIIPDSSHGAGKVYRLRQDEEFAALKLVRGYEDVAGKKVRWLRCSGRFMVPENEYDIYRNSMLVMHVKRKGEVIAWHGVRINNKLSVRDSVRAGGKVTLFDFREKVWGDVSYFVPLPADFQRGDTVQLDIWNIRKSPLYCSGLCMECFE